jgi:hypothetical protein
LIFFANFTNHTTEGISDFENEITEAYRSMLKTHHPYSPKKETINHSDAVKVKIPGLEVKKD